MVEPLEIVPYPVPIEAHDPEVGGGSVVRLFFQPGDRSAAPDVDLAEVVILETWDRVSIGLVRRGVTGEGPDGVSYGESLLRRAGVSLDVALAEPARGCVDGRGSRPGGAPIRRPLHTETVGTPLWRQFWDRSTPRLRQLGNRAPSWRVATALRFLSMEASGDRPRRGSQRLQLVGTGTPRWQSGNERGQHPGDVQRGHAATNATVSTTAATRARPVWLDMATMQTADTPPATYPRR